MSSVAAAPAATTLTSPVRFAKMHGCGNDFVVLDSSAFPAAEQRLRAEPALCRWVADRRRGIGCDQILVTFLQQSTSSPQPTTAASAAAAADIGAEGHTRCPGVFGYRIFNADGSEVGMCGNGLRCLTRFLLEQTPLVAAQFAPAAVPFPLELAVQTPTRMTQCRMAAPGGAVAVSMGRPELAPDQVPYSAAHKLLLPQPPPSASALPHRARLLLPGVGGSADSAEEVAVGLVSMGNPHAVLMVDDVDTAPVERLGPPLERHPALPERANIGFCQIVDAARIRLRVFERGVGETPACGSGACAAVVCGRLDGRLGPEVDVEMPGGTLRVRWDMQNRQLQERQPGDGGAAASLDGAIGDANCAPVWLMGHVATAFTGSVVLPTADELGLEC